MQDSLGATNPRGETTPLEERLIALIRARGPITVADYMADALMHPHDGYYTTQAAIGAGGDFTTAPEISQIFGELIGVWLVQAWTEMGEPDDFNLVELGPGRGALMADILRAARVRPRFLAAAHVWLIEASGRMRHEQKRRLAAATPAIDTPIDWADNLAALPDGPMLIVANEFFDCLPIRQFVRVETGWRERLVALNDTGDRLAFTLSPTPPTPETPIPSRTEGVPGDIVEICQPAVDLMEEIALELVRRTGRALIFDYGYRSPGFGETLQAVRRHACWPVLEAPGRADITAHVDFERLIETAFDAGAAAWGPVAQGTLLDRLGLSLRVRQLCEAAPDRIEAIAAGADRIASPRHMGEIFKAICVSSPDLPAPAGFLP